MAIKLNICASVEGTKLSFNTRQFFSKPPIYNEHLQKNVYPFKLGINGYVEIEAPLENPQQAVINMKSLIAQGDAVQGGSIDGWATNPIKKPKVGTGTGTHSANFGSLRGHCYAHVQSPHRDHLQSADVQARHPEVVVVINPIYCPSKAETS